MRREHKLLFKFLGCTGVEFGFNQGNKIHASEENKEYAKCKDCDRGKIYKTYSHLFRSTYNSSQFSLTPTKMSLCGFGLGPNSDEESMHDKFPINAESTNSSNGPAHVDATCSMDVSTKRSGEKRKGKTTKEREKRNATEQES